MQTTRTREIENQARERDDAKLRDEAKEIDVEHEAAIASAASALNALLGSMSTLATVQDRRSAFDAHHPMLCVEVHDWTFVLVSQVRRELFLVKSNNKPAAYRDLLIALGIQ